MKKIIYILLLTLIAGYGYGQTHGISYQAVIIDENGQEIPGIDIQGNVLPDHPLTVRFTIFNELGAVDYQEDHTTRTDKYGMIYLTIGRGVPTPASPDVFEEISWDGTGKDLRVEIRLGESGGDFIEFSEQEFYFVPYAFHRNITATGTLKVADSTTLNNVLEVNAASFMNGKVTINDTLEVNAPGVMNGEVTINDVLEVNAPGFLNGQVTVSTTVNGRESQYSAYPFRVEGSNQGIAVRVNGSRDSENNFVSFWDNAGMQGRIEGQVDSDVYTNPQYIFDQSIYAAQTATQIANSATASASAVADPGNAIIEVANAATLAAEIASYNIFAFQDLGVTYESSAGDYAEWLPRLDPEEKISPGQIVGVFGGKITKVTDGAEQVMVISNKPIVLGNMPPQGLDKDQCEKVGFIGQVQVWVMGPVKEGDYIVAYASGSGLGKAIPPEALTLNDLNKIVGRSWSSSDYDGINLINTVIGIKTNELVNIIRKQQERLTVLEKQITTLKEAMNNDRKLLMILVPGYKDALQAQRTGLQVPGRHSEIADGYKEIPLREH